MKYTIDDVEKWIMEQPDDRKVCMFAGDLNRGKTTCVLSEFLKEKHTCFFWTYVNVWGNVRICHFMWEKCVVDLRGWNIFNYFPNETGNTFKGLKENFTPLKPHSTYLSD